MNQPGGVVIVILAKDADHAKKRLGLDREAARRVAVGLAATTVRRALAARSVGHVLVVTGDPVIAADATAAGAVVAAEMGRHGMNRAATLGRQQARRLHPMASIGILVADLPNLTATDLDITTTEFLMNRSPMYVADHHTTGTTFLIHGPDQTPGIAFGYESARMHRRLGYRKSRHAPPGLCTDLDTPEDLLAARDFLRCVDP